MLAVTGEACSEEGAGFYPLVSFRIPDCACACFRRTQFLIFPSPPARVRCGFTVFTAPCLRGGPGVTARVMAAIFLRSAAGYCELGSLPGDPADGKTARNGIDIPYSKNLGSRPPALRARWRNDTSEFARCTVRVILKTKPEEVLMKRPPCADARVGPSQSFTYTLSPETATPLLESSSKTTVRCICALGRVECASAADTISGRGPASCTAPRAGVGPAGAAGLAVRALLPVACMCTSRSRSSLALTLSARACASSVLGFI